MSILSVLFFFFFNDPASAETSTLGHTLSLHYALPILAGRHVPGPRLLQRGNVRSRGLPPVPGLAQRPRVRVRRAPRGFACAASATVRALFRHQLPRPPRGVQHDEAHHDRNRRSEEHTSELPSLMRISYAVFCLKKKKTH